MNIDICQMQIKQSNFFLKFNEIKFAKNHANYISWPNKDWLFFYDIVLYVVIFQTFGTISEGEKTWKMLYVRWKVLLSQICSI